MLACIAASLASIGAIAVGAGAVVVQDVPANNHTRGPAEFGLTLVKCMIAK